MTVDRYGVSGSGIGAVAQHGAGRWPKMGDRNNDVNTEAVTG
jgi:hypothetical protein